MRLHDSYNIPEKVVAGPHSEAFHRFLWNWFGDTAKLTAGELDVSFLDELAGEELRMARALIRQNLHLGQDHIVQAAAALRDLGAVPVLGNMLRASSDDSRRLIISGALWNLVRDSAFVAALDRVKFQPGSILRGAHLCQALWLDDERAMDYMIDVLEHPDRAVRSLSLVILNTVETGRHTLDMKALTYGPDEYRTRRLDPAFREEFVGATRRHNRTKKTGSVFGFQSHPFQE